MKNFLLIFLLAATTTFAQTPVIIADLNPGNVQGAEGYLTSYNGVLLFFGNNGNTGFELYQSNGTSVSLMQDMVPGATGSHIGASSTGQPMAVVGSKVYMVVDSSSSVVKLKKFDGTNTPTYITNGVYYRCANKYTAVMNGKIYFSGYTTALGDELMVYDPATDVVSLAKDIFPGASGSAINNITPYRNKLYFTAENTASIYAEPFVYDPVTDTAYMLDDILPGSASSNARNFTVINDTLYFTAVTTTYGRELYKYTGTGLPVRITDVCAGSFDGTLGSSAFYKGSIYFGGNSGAGKYQLYRYDIAGDSTTLVQNIQSGQNTQPGNFIAYANKLYFTATTSAAGNELWVYDGNNPATMVADINPGASGSGITDLYIHNKTLFFIAMASGSHRELYRLYDPAAAAIIATRFDATIAVYPNPVTEDAILDITLTNATDLQISLTDEMGRVVYTLAAKAYAPGKHSIPLPMQSLSTGEYYCRVSNANDIVLAASKLLKE